MAEPGHTRVVSRVLYDGALRWRDQPAVIIDDHEVTYSDVVTRAQQLAYALHRAHLSRGDKLLIMLPNSLDFVDAWLGASLAGVIEVPIHTAYQGDVLRHIVANSGATTIMLDELYIERIVELMPDLGNLSRVVVVTKDGNAVNAIESSLEVVMLKELVNSSEVIPLPDLHEHDPLAIMYTSGSTGPQKGVVISHRHAYEYARAVGARVLALEPGDRYYAPLPLFHIAGQWAVVYASLITGATAVMRESFSVSSFWSDCRRYNATVGFLLGAMAQFLIAQDGMSDDADNPLDRVLVAPLIEDLDGFAARFRTRIRTCYGSTEAGIPILTEEDVAGQHERIVGRPVEGYEVRLVDENDEDVPVGSVGELVIRPPEPWRAITRYHDNPEATAEAFRNLWFHTGDALRCDELGNYYFVDRLGETIRRRGENIASFDVEQAANAFSAVMESAAFAVPSEYTEDEVALVVVPRPGQEIDVEELRAFVGGRLPRFMVPAFIHIAPQLPKTPTGKVQKYLLRALIASGEQVTHGPEWQSAAEHNSS